MINTKALLAFAWLALLAICSAQEPNCDGLICDECPVYRDTNGTKILVESTTDCIVKNGVAELTCRCAEPPKGALPLNARDVDIEVANDGEAVENGDDDVNDLPPDGGSGGSRPTQSNGASSGAKASILFLAAAAMLAATTFA